MRSTASTCSVLLGILAVVRSQLHNNLQTPASIQQFPYFGSIEVKGEHKCSATIIDDKYVITTNTCVQGNDVNDLGVRVGTARQGHRGEFFKVVSVTPYVASPFFGPTFTYDFAMVKVAVSFTYDLRVMWANPNADGIEELQEGTVVGWADPKIHASPLRSVPVYVLPSQNCSEIYSGIMNISENMFCLFPKDPSSELCIANMGAPFYDNEQCYGIVTHTTDCSTPDLPLVVTGISKLTSYIIMVLCDMQTMFGSSADAIDNFDFYKNLLAAEQ